MKQLLLTPALFFAANIHAMETSSANVPAAPPTVITREAPSLYSLALKKVKQHPIAITPSSRKGLLIRIMPLFKNQCFDILKALNLSNYKVEDL